MTKNAAQRSIRTFYEGVNFETGYECFISDIVGSLNIGAPTISHHLKELANADLIITERRGKFLAARINKETIQTANAILSLIET